jgi:hypothetical protein
MILQSMMVLLLISGLDTAHITVECYESEVGVIGPENVHILDTSCSLTKPWHTVQAGV